VKLISYVQINFRKWRLTPLTFRIGSLIVLVHIVVAIAGRFWTPYPYFETGAGVPFSGASWEHLMGVDYLGRDVLSRVLYGGHLVIFISVSGTLFGLVVGSVVGLISGYIGGWFDEILQRILEAMISIPFLVFGLLIVAAAGPKFSGNLFLLVSVIAFVYAPRIARLARVAALEISTRDFVTSARLRGESVWSVIRIELLPNATGTLLVEFAIRAGFAPVLVASLGFLGFGLRPPTPEWGLMMSENRALIMVSPIIVMGPGLMLASLVVGLNLWTEGLARILGRSVHLAPS